MVYISDLQQLISSWQERADSGVHSSTYKDGVMDCIYELNQLINNKILKSLTAREAHEHLLWEEKMGFLNTAKEYNAAAV